MSVKNYIGRGLTTLALTGSLFLGGCGESQPPQSQRLEQRISQEVAQPNGKPDKYAVLVRGDNEKRHIANFSLAYQVLIENGFSPKNIYILTDDGKKQFYHPVDDVASRENLERILAHLSKKVDEKDIFLFYLNNHGGRESFKSTDGNEKIEISKFGLRGRDINEIELEAYLSQITPKRKILVFDFCYDGGFSERFGKGNDLAVSSAPKDKISKARVNDSFSGYFFGAFREKSGADYDKNGKTSISEAYKFAKENHSWSKSGKNKPQLISEISPDEVFLK